MRLAWAAVPVALMVAATVSADVTTDPYLFEAPAMTPAGTFEWDTFAGSFAGPHTPDVASAGTGAAELTGSGVTAPPFNFPAPLVSSSSNLYSGAGTGTYRVDLTGLDAGAAQSTVVLQLAYVPGTQPLSGFTLDGETANVFLDRGVREGVKHGLGSALPTTYLWMVWILPAKADYLLTFDTGTHTNVAALRIDHFNADAPVVPPSPAAVPEPSAIALLTLAAAATLSRRPR